MPHDHRSQMRPPPWAKQAGYATTSSRLPDANAARVPPPPALAYKKVAAVEAPRVLPPHPESVPEEEKMKEKAKKGGLLSRLWPFKPQESIYLKSQDPTRGREAARRVVQYGVLNQMYKGGARSFTVIMCALPIAIYTSYELLQRRFGGKERRREIIAQSTAGDTP